MIRKTLYIFILLILAGCTCDGDIGDLYGQWAIDNYSIDGTPLAQEAYENIFWSFQGEVVQIRELDTNHSYLTYPGTFCHEGNKLTLEFSSSGKLPAELLGKLGWNATKISLDVNALNASSMTLSYISEDGDLYCYQLRKLK